MKMCDSCSGPNQCSSCRSPFILLPNRDGCAPPIKDCIVDASEYIAQSDENGKTTWKCPQCKPGMFWNATDNTCSSCSKQFVGCAECDVERCHSCADTTQIPTYDGQTCQETFDNCDVDPKDYAVDPYTNSFVCQQCKAPYFFGWWEETVSNNPPV